MAFALTLAGCSGQTLGMNNLSPSTKANLVGAGTGTLLGAAGGALVGAAITGAPGLGAGVGALIGAGAGWAVASQSQSMQAQLAETDAQVRQQRAEIEENRRRLDLARGQAPLPSASQSASTVPQVGGRQYVVKNGDTLSGIAKAAYGNAGEYRKIFDANEPMLKDPNRIYPGQMLRLPQ
ncbi:MAG TPA: LysM peptidoglycan-binding domain-containing protein [Candidatus Binataceae bacterium]|nr:LysM peptidoglycan-binding domain-containing protein [Candidatus Binataceae bacterium]